MAEITGMSPDGKTPRILDISWTNDGQVQLWPHKVDIVEGEKGYAAVVVSRSDLLRLLESEHMVSGQR